jgi:hypothetical protein
LRFRLREALRPLELARLLSLGALVEESLSTRLDSVRAPDRLCVDEDLLRLEPDVRLRELPLDRLFDDEERPLERPLAFDEEPLLEPLLLDRDFCWGILPWLLLDRSLRVRRLPESDRSTRTNPTVQARTRLAVQTPSSAGNANKPPARKTQLARKAKRGEK